jgi:hypothetical protein
MSQLGLRIQLWLFSCFVILGKWFQSLSSISLFCLRRRTWGEGFVLTNFYKSVSKEGNLWKADRAGKSLSKPECRV